MKPARGPQTMFLLSMVVVESLSCQFEWGLGGVHTSPLYKHSRKCMLMFVFGRRPAIMNSRLLAAGLRYLGLGT